MAMTQEERIQAMREGKAKKAAERAAAKAIAQEDPERLVHQMVDQALGVAQPPPRRPPPNYVAGTDDPDIAAEKMSVQILQETERQAAEARAARRTDSRGRVQDQPQGRIPVEVLAIRDWAGDVKMPDPMAMEDDEGNSLLKEGYCGRWVRVKDDLDQRNENSLRVRRMKVWGAEPVLNPDGTPLRTETLVAMQLPIRQNALRKIQASRSGALDAAKQIDNLHDEADRVNSEFSRRYHGASQGVIQLAAMPGTGQEAAGVRPFAPSGYEE